MAILAQANQQGSTVLYVSLGGQFMALQSTTLASLKSTNITFADGPQLSGPHPIAVTLFKDGSCEVADDGRGMPVDIHPEEKIPGVELILTRLHAGGKFSNKNYTFSGGLHGDPEREGYGGAVEDELLSEDDRT